MSCFGRSAWAAIFAVCVAANAAAADDAAASSARLDAASLQPISRIVHAEIAARRIPGAVVEIGQGERVVYRGAFGWREFEPRRVPMTVDTIFDLASLTKPVATSVAIMQLVEQGKLDLDSPAARYWPRFAHAGKDRITVRDLLTHYSGLRADLDLSREWRGHDSAMRMIEEESPRYPAGTHYLYSDVNFEVLGEIVARVSGKSLDEYCAVRIFAPLGMRDTCFLPAPSVRDRIAPTGFDSGRLRVGTVHDPTAARMGGIAGDAGLFSTADDLAKFAQMMLSGGRARGGAVLTASSIDQMTLPESPSGAQPIRGLGWDLGAPLCSNRERLAPVGSWGHTGYTGTMLWIDPVSNAWVVVLTNRTYLNHAGDAAPLRKAILALVADRLGPLNEATVIARRPALADYCRLVGAQALRAAHPLADGADVLVADRFAELDGRRFGLITNKTGVTSSGARDIDAIRQSKGLKLVALFSPEHGLDGNVDEPVASGFEPSTGTPVFSLFGEVKRPTDQMLEGLDGLVFDVQDAGARFYTYVTTMAYAMESAAKHGLDFYVLDRPNPIGGDVVQGPVLDRDRESFTGYFPMAVRYGMTMGELATMFNAENHLGARLHVIRMRGYDRRNWYDDTGLPWINPSPNLRSLTQATLYPGVAMVEGANLSVGRGTATPFEVVGAPWIDAHALADYLNARQIPGVQFAATDFTPTADAFVGQRCHGVRIIVVDRAKLDSPEFGVELASAFNRLHGAKFRLDLISGAIGSRETIDGLRSGDDPRAIAARWEPSLAQFRSVREKYLLY